ncbi:unnamed protein product [Rotaria sp. Silwood1]|nr:unnamed protein product [Rotaria sp. Silwood1]
MGHPVYSLMESTTLKTRQHQDTEEMKIAVVGLGGPGSAALRHLARSGHQAVGYEQFHIGHAHGSSHVALYQQDSGFLRATRCVQANIRLAKAHGAIVHERTPVIEIIPSSENGKILVRCSSDDIIDEEFDRVIVTAADGTFPVWIDSDANYYGFPSDGQIDGIKLASDNLGETITDLDAHRPPVDDVHIDQMRQYAEKRFLNLGKNVTHSQTCIYTNTPNADFIIDHVPDQPNVFLVSGCSGHGFKSFIEPVDANLLYKRY